MIPLSVTTHVTRLFRFLYLRVVFYHLTGSVPTEELKSIKRQVFKGKNGPNGNAGLSDSDDLASISSNRSNSLVLDEHDEMNMSDAAAVMEDFDDEPVENDD
jgi:hypothetical protein